MSVRSDQNVPSARSVPNALSLDRVLHAALAAVLLALFVPLVAHAASDSASQHFDAGKRAFAEQNYAAALDAFEAAAAAGMTGPVVQFNIGVCAYRVGQLPRAAAAFRETARTPAMAALAHYNLGLVALAADNTDEAARWFALAQREASDERLRSLTAQQLARLRQPVERNWLAYGSLAAGYDDNVALVSGSDVLGVSGIDDSFVELQLAGSAPLTSSWRFDGGLVLLDYQDLDRFDQLSISAGARYRVPLGEWHGEAGLQLAHSTLDGEGFENNGTLILQGTRRLLPEWWLRLRYRFSAIEGLASFDGLDGTRHDLGIRGAWRRGRWDVLVEYRFNRSDYRQESLSLDRHQLSVDAQYALGVNWSMQAGLVHDRSRYAVREIGRENRTELVLGVSRNLGTQWRAVARFAHADNRAHVPEFDYGRNRISAGVEASW